MSNISKRDRLIDSASYLFHTNGLSSTSLADIARHADIPIGNVYYYFKTKEELAIAAVTRRKEQFAEAYALLEEAIPDPRQRLVQAAMAFDKMKDEYTRSGCPVGKIVFEADVEKDQVSQAAAQIYGDFIAWAARQFEQLGHSGDARKYATHMLTSIEGSALMAKSFRNASIMTDEINRLATWLESLPNKKIQLGKAGLRMPEATTAA